jgi:hemerythrin
MTITYSNGTVLEVIVLAHEEEGLRVAVAGDGDVRTFQFIHGVWISEECEPVAVEFDIDYYEFLQISPQAEVPTIQRIYRLEIACGLMNNRERDLKVPRWLRQAIITRAEDIRTLRNRGFAVEVLRVAHDTIELILQSLGEAVLSGGSRAEVIEILNTSIDFCATHFADEEEFMRERGHAHLDAHVAAHRQLLAKFVAARRRASGEGLSLATLDVVDLLHDFDAHVKPHVRATQPSPRKTLTHASHGG